MAATKTTEGKRAGTKMPALPPVTVQRFEETLKLVERVYESQNEGALGKMQDYLDRNREATRRPITAEEAVHYAGILRNMVEQDVASPAELQNSDLYVAKEPSPQELLIASLASAAPALLDALRGFTALIEMPADVFEQAADGNVLGETIAEHSAALRKISMVEGRERMQAAFAHWGKESGLPSGEAASRLWQAASVALQQAAVTVTRDLSHDESSTDSLAPIGGLAGTS